MDVNHSREFPRLRGRGFSLVELIVVIGIICLLLALLIPAFGMARDASRTLVCATNLKQMGVAMTAYRMDHGYYPGHCGWSQAGSPVAIWPVRLRPYFDNNRTLFYCPSRDEAFKWQLTIGTPGGPYATQKDCGFGYKLGELMLSVFTFPSTYGYNDWGTIGAFDAPDGKQKGLGGDIGHGYMEVSATCVVNPAEMVAIGDNTPDGSWDYNLDPTNPSEYPGNLHKKGCNILFADGHVQWFLQSTLTNVFPGNPSAGYMNAMWNNDHKVWY